MADSTSTILSDVASAGSSASTTGSQSDAQMSKLMKLAISYAKFVYGKSWSKSVTAEQRTLVFYFPNIFNYLNPTAETLFGITKDTIQAAFYSQISLIASHCDSNMSYQSYFTGKVAQLLDVFCKYVWAVNCGGYLSSGVVMQVGDSNPTDITTVYVEWSYVYKFLSQVKKAPALSGPGGSVIAPENSKIKLDWYNTTKAATAITVFDTGTSTISYDNAAIAYLTGVNPSVSNVISAATSTSGIIFIIVLILIAATAVYLRRQ